MGLDKRTGEATARQLVDWILVTLVLTIAFFVLLQVIGEQVRDAIEWGRTLLISLKPA